LGDGIIKSDNNKDIDLENPSSPPFTKGRNYPSLKKRGEGRFCNDYVNSILRPFITQK
jgi:hypothetical protein